MPSIRIEAYSMVGVGGATLVDRVDQAEAYGEVAFGDTFATSSSWLAIWQNPYDYEALVVLRRVDADHEARVDQSMPAADSAAFLVSTNENRRVLLRAGRSIYVKTLGN